jgi:cytidylate kinase
MKHTIITIGRQYGSGGHEVAEQLAEKLSIPLFDKQVLTEAAKNSGFSENLFHTYDEVRESSLLYALSTGSIAYGSMELPLPVQLCMEQFKTIGQLAEQGSCIFVGRCADYVLRERSDLVSVFIHAPMKQRAARIGNLYNVGTSEAERQILRADRKRRSYYEHYTDREWGVASTYHLSLDSGEIGIAGCVSMIEAYLGVRGLL